ncbi:TPA: radical SAM protein [Bacillus anthracis]|nr:radical SAM protein [Bacillus anthracis]
MNSIIKSRYKNEYEANESLEAYLHGARYGVVGHITMYPFSNSSLDYDPINMLDKKLVHITPVGMYIHWPFCYLPYGIEKCDFCMCNTKNDGESVSLRKQYFQAILNEIRMYASLLKGQSVEWVYMGGGTPLTMTSSELDELFTTMYSQRVINNETYISIESRPEVVTRKKIEVLKKHNVSRVSMGVESFHEETVVAMGRVRRGMDYYKVVKKAVDLLREIGIPYFNLDFIYSHPKDEFDIVLDSIKKALDFAPDSLAIYPLGLPYKLTPIEKEILANGNIKSLDFRLECFTAINNLLMKNGYSMVSDSIWSNCDMYSHKSFTDKKMGIPNFWNQTCTVQHGIWLPVGVGGIGFIEGTGVIQNINNIPQYIEMVNNKKLGICKGPITKKEELMRGEIIISLLHRVIDIENFISHFGIHPVEAFEIEFKLLEQKNLIELNEKEIKLTSKAIPLAQGIARFFISIAEEEKFRKSESNRVDYKIYNISYNGLA